MPDPNSRVELKVLEQLPWLVCLPQKWWRNADTSVSADSSNQRVAAHFNPRDIASTFGIPQRIATLPRLGDPTRCK